VLKRDWISAKSFLKGAGELSYDVEITPYDNRVIIPKLGKNIPLVNVENQKVGNAKDWNKIFETELEKGVIKYPGSANPGEPGNAFVFGHSSNFPWIKGDYNEVFAMLDKLSFGDEMIVYFKQKKYVYVVREKHVIKPGYVNAMKGKEESKQLTLMTCWPIGTTLNRLIVMGELKEETPAAGVARNQGNLISMK
jgi:LPXTG-site transpeptidase (sortase) family protein